MTTVVVFRTMGRYPSEKVSHQRESEPYVLTCTSSSVPLFGVIARLGRRLPDLAGDRRPASKSKAAGLQKNTVTSTFRMLPYELT